MPVISRAIASSAGILGGFETGNAIKQDSVYHLFLGEKASPTTCKPQRPRIVLPPSFDNTFFAPNIHQQCAL